MRDYNHPANRKCHFGTSGIGKTTDFLSRLRDEIKKSKEKNLRVFIFDHKREFSQKLGVTVCETEAQLTVATAKGGIICYSYQLLFEGNRKAGADFFCRFIYSVSEHLPGRKIAVFDEIQEWAGPTDTPDSLITMMDDGRSFKIDPYLIAQSPNGVNTLVRNQLTESFIFRQGDDNACEWFAQKGFDCDRIQNLRPGEWLWKNLNTGQAAYGGKAFKINTEGIPSGGTLIAGPAVENRGK